MNRIRAHTGPLWPYAVLVAIPLLGFVLPNFFFHVTTAYDILRHNGVELGKLDYLGGR